MDNEQEIFEQVSSPPKKTNKYLIETYKIRAETSRREDESEEDFRLRVKELKRTRDMRCYIKKTLGLPRNGYKLTEEDVEAWQNMRKRVATDD